VNIGAKVANAGFNANVGVNTENSQTHTGVAVNGTAALLLVPLGILLFHEQFSVQKVLGIVLTLSGIYFLASK